MSLFTLPALHQARTTIRRSTRSFRPGWKPDVESLELRTVLSGPGSAMLAPAILQSPLTITGVNVTNLAITGANSLLATVNLNGTLNTVLGSTAFTIPNIQVPISLTTTTPAGGTPILHLALEIPDLNLLGLHVQLDNCNNGPVTVDITAIPSGQTGGGLLGDLLGGLSGLLGGSGGLLNLGDSAGGLTGALTQVLNGILTDLTTGTTTAPGGTGGTAAPGGPTTDAIPAGDVSLVDLHIGAIHANILGLDVQTSEICLRVFADPNGGLLGGLLASLDNLLNNSGNNGHAQTILVRNILRDLAALRL